MRTVLVTGSEGNIGRYLVRTLRSAHPSWRILRVARRLPSSETPGGEIFTGDLCDASFVRSLFARENVDIVIHGASTSYHQSGYAQSPFSTFQNDASMVLRLLEAAAGVKRFVYLSSALVYEHATAFPLTEEMADQLPAPTSSYGLAKFFGERAVKLACKQYGIPFTLWRLFNVVSPLEPHDKPGGHVFVDFYRKLFVEQVETMSVMGSGRQVRCFLWVQDAVDCIVDYLESAAAENDVFNVAGAEAKTLIDLKDTLLSIGKELGAIDRGYNPAMTSGTVFDGVESERRIPSVDKARARLGWAPKTGFDDCFRQFISAKRAL